MHSIEKEGFSPDNFGALLIRDIDHSSGSNESYYIKGGKEMVEIGASELDEIMGRLRAQEKVKIVDLKGNLAKDYQKIVSYVSLLYNTSKYNIIYDLAVKHFGNLERITPGTVGSYFAGCIVNIPIEDANPGCSVTCAGSLPKPKGSEGWAFCDKAVIWGLYEDGKYKFTVTLDAEDKTHSILHLNCTNYKTCPGFTQEDKKHLMDLGVEKVTLYGYRNNGRDHVKLSDEPISVCDLRSPNGNGNGNGGNGSSTDNNSGLPLIILILILIALFFAWRFLSNQGRIYED